MKSRFYTFFFPLSIFLFFIGSVCTHAESFDSVALRILDNGPESVAEGFELAKAYSNLSVSANLPDPEIGGEYLFAPESEENRWAVEATWDLEWPGVYNARKKEAKSQMVATQNEIKNRRAERLAEIKSLLLDYIQCRLKLELLEDLNRNNDSIYRLSQQSHKGGEMTVLDLNKIRIEYANIRAAKVALMDEESSVVQELSNLYGGDCSSILLQMDCEFPAIELPTEARMEGIKENAPAIQHARAREEVAVSGIKTAKMEALPSLTVGYKHAYEEMTHFNGAILGISIPIFSNRGKKKQAEVDYLDTRFQTDRAITQVSTESQQSLKRLRILEEQIRELTPVVDHANFNETLLKAYRGGVITLIDYLTERNYFTTAAMELVALRHNAAKLQVSLYRYLSE